MQSNESIFTLNHSQIKSIDVASYNICVLAAIAALCVAMSVCLSVCPPQIDSIDMATYECVDCQLTSLVANENRYPNVVLLLNIKAAIQNKDWRRKSRKPMIQSI